MDNYKQDSSAIWKTLKSITFSVNIRENAGRNDKMFYRLMQEGVQEKDIEKLYKYIHASENGTGNPYDEPLYKIISKAYETDPIRLYQFISEKNDLLYYWALLSMCNSEALCYFATVDTDNTLFLYECARQILRQFPTDGMRKDSIITAIIKIANNDQILWARWIHKSEHNMYWTSMIGRVLEQISAPALLTYAKTISLGAVSNTQILEEIHNQLMSLSDDTAEHIFNVISDTVCERWRELVEHKKKEERSCLDIYISRYIYVIVYSLYHKFDKQNDWEDELIKWINIFKQDMQKWFISRAEMGKYYFLDLSYIYYLLLIKDSRTTETLNLETIKLLERLKLYISQYIYLTKDTNNGGFKSFMILLDRLIQQKDKLDK